MARGVWGGGVLSECMCVFTLDVTLDDVWVCREQTRFGVMCVSASCAHMCVPETKRVGVESVLVRAWFMSAYILSPTFQIFLYVRLCLVTTSVLCFLKIHLFCVHLTNFC